MNGTLILILFLGLSLGATSVLALVLALRLRSRMRRDISIYSDIEQIREIGHLSVLKVYTKEIVTESKHDWGDIGSRYFGWILTTKKMAMVFEFQIDFRYDLRSPAFSIHGADRGTVIVRMPPCIHEVTLQNVQFYDEQQARLLPWLLPDLLNGFFSRGFTEQDKNGLIAAAKRQAEHQARAVIKSFLVNVEGSATTTLRAICRSLGAREVVLDFEHESEPRVSVSYGPVVAA
jgi:hypothetical protein